MTLSLQIRAFFLGTVLTLAGCESTDLVVVGPPSASSDAGGDDVCDGNEDCDGESFCARTACGDATGRCARKPLLCNESVAPVCGCDGTNYWNDCLRRQHGASAASVEECPRPRPCDDQHSCGGGAFCARIRAPRDATCGGPSIGECWVLPERCPEYSPKLLSTCTNSCENACTLIRTEAAARFDGRCR